MCFKKEMPTSFSHRAIFMTKPLSFWKKRLPNDSHFKD